MSTSKPVRIAPVAKPGGKPKEEPDTPAGVAGIFGTAAEREEDDTQDRLDSSVLPEFLGKEFAIMDFPCRMITAATISLLRHIDSPLIKGLPYEDILNPYEEAVKFLAIQDEGITVVEARKLAYDDEALKDRVYEIMEGLPANATDQLVTDVVEKLRDATSTRVKPVAKGKKKSEELGNS